MAPDIDTFVRLLKCSAVRLLPGLAAPTCLHKRLDERVMCFRGELPEEMAAAYEKQHKTFEALQKSLASLAESLEHDMPALPETTTRFTGEGTVSLVTRQVRISMPCFPIY